MSNNIKFKFIIGNINLRLVFINIPVRLLTVILILIKNKNCLNVIKNNGLYFHSIRLHTLQAHNLLFSFNLPALFILHLRVKIE